MYFGKYAEMYFDEKRKDEESGIVRRSRKTDSYFRLLNNKFTLEDLEKAANVSKKTAYNIVSRWIGERKLSPLSKNRGYYVKER
jgi:predicted transcriptional regulator